MTRVCELALFLFFSFDHIMYEKYCFHYIDLDQDCLQRKIIRPALPSGSIVGDEACCGHLYLGRVVQVPGLNGIQIYNFNSEVSGSRSGTEHARSLQRTSDLYIGSVKYHMPAWLWMQKEKKQTKLVDLMHIKHRRNLFFFQLDTWKPLNLSDLRNDLQEVLDSGIRSLAVVLMHSYM